MANGNKQSTASDLLSRPANLKKQAGFSLVEMVIAILLTAIIVLGTFSALLMTKMDTAGGNSQMAAALAQRQILESLKLYESADVTVVSGPNNGSWDLPGGTGNACTGADSSGNSYCPPACQPNATFTGCSAKLAACKNLSTWSANPYALQPCCIHEVDNMLPTSLSNARMCYIVTDESYANSTTDIVDQSLFKPQIQVFVQWTGKQ